MMICFKRLLVVDLCQLVSQSLTIQLCCDHLTIGTVKDSGRNASDVIETKGLIVPSLQFAKLRPRDAQVLYSFLPSLLIRVERYAHHLKTFILVFLVTCLRIRNLCTTWTTPTGPEIHQSIVTLTDIISKMARIAFYVMISKSTTSVPSSLFLFPAMAMLTPFSMGMSA